MKGILFSNEMVKAITAGKKTVTRRLSQFDYINQQPGQWDIKNFLNGCVTFEHNILFSKITYACFYKKHETLYVKESYLYEKGKIVYKANENYPDKTYSNKLFMKEIDARFFIKISNVSVSRLMDKFTEDEAQAEGFRNVHEFCTYWDTLNTNFPSKTNPWVWIIRYNQIEKGEI